MLSRRHFFLLFSAEQGSVFRNKFGRRDGAIPENRTVFIRSAEAIPVFRIGFGRLVISFSVFRNASIRSAKLVSENRKVCSKKVELFSGKVSLSMRYWGIRNVKQVFSLAEETERVPPCAWAISEAMYSPSPKP